MGLFEFGNEPVIDGFSVKSNDELAELIIPKGALPSNVDPDDVSVTRILSTSIEDESWMDYELEPDGLEFTDEILLKVQLDNDNDAFPIVFILNDTGIDLISNTRINVDLENNTKIISIPLTHFSTITIAFTGTFDLKTSALDTIVGEPVKTTASLTLIKTKFLREMKFHGKGFMLFEFLEPNIKYKGTWFGLDAGMSPKSISGKPSYTQLIVGQTNTVQDDTFTCENEANLASLSYFVEITADAKITTYNSEKDYLDGVTTSNGTFRNQKFEIEQGEFFLSYNPKLNIQSLNLIYYENKPEFTMIVEIDGPANTTGIVTLTGLGMEPMIQPLIIGPNGSSTGNTFRLTFTDEITVLAEVGELTAERKKTPKSEW